MKKIPITVTQEDIDAPIGVFRARTCPVARAIARAIPGSNPHVGIASVVLNDPKCSNGEVCALPFAAEYFIKQFDKLGYPAVRPFTFELESHQ